MCSKPNIKYSLLIISMIVGLIVFKFYERDFQVNLLPEVYIFKVVSCLILGLSLVYLYLKSLQSNKQRECLEKESSSLINLLDRFRLNDSQELVLASVRGRELLLSVSSEGIQLLDSLGLKTSFDDFKKSEPKACNIREVSKLSCYASK